MRPLLTLLIGLMALGVAGAAPAPAKPCRTERFEGDSFTVCRYTPGGQDLRLVLTGRAAAPLRSLPALEVDLGPAAARVAFAMNAGIYGEDGRPIGLYVEDGRTVRKLNRRTSTDGSNFYMKPNGVFWVDAAGRPRVDETGAYAARAPKAVWATQSGPLLVGRGKLNPLFGRDGPSRYVRNGVGVKGEAALFVISDRPVSFGRMARFLRDGLGCPDALYFDGSVSSLWAPSLGRQDSRDDLGPMVVVLTR